ncbi:MAG: HIT family protein [Nitratireductor sp.]|uniref:HIT domain-containing protein n=1 Tax=Nitratireductor sp. B36 TaxID=2762059 RepID=UPI000C8CF462|nr:HIT family protein [Nitratireductor sp. B36]MAS11735.1 HIT family protein [Nitratireductor sp.]MCC5780711.1 HIT domain-containing protein [Nitratireductor sp. B36]
MLPDAKQGFELDPKLEAESLHVMWLGLCELRLCDDRRWPWLILVPQRPGAEEIHDLTPLDQAMVSFETNMVAQMLKELTGCTKINSAALGNVVRQLHIHVVARSEDDPGWPGPVWGHGVREPYRREDLHQFAETIRGKL